MCRHLLEPAEGWGRQRQNFAFFKDVYKISHRFRASGKTSMDQDAPKMNPKLHPSTLNSRKTTQIYLDKKHVVNVWSGVGDLVVIYFWIVYRYQLSTAIHSYPKLSKTKTYFREISYPTIQLSNTQLSNYPTIQSYPTGFHGNFHNYTTFSVCRCFAPLPPPEGRAEFH